MRIPRPKRIRGGRRWLGRLLAGLALVIAVAIVVVVVVNAGSSTPNASGSTSKPSGSTAVQRRNLVETDTESGTLSYNSPQTVYNRMTGTLTWLPEVGQVIRAGQTLYKVDGQAVLLMDGTTPAYRDLSPSDSDGADIEELNRNLVKLGFNAANITVDDVWQAATTEGVDLLQESLGETETGTLTLGRIVFLPGDQLVTTVDGTLGSTGGTSASATVSPPAPEFVDYSVPVTPSAPPAHDASAHKAAKAKKCPSTTGTSSPSTTGTATTGTTSTTPAESTTSSQSNKCKSKNSGKPTAEQQLQALLALLKAETQQLRHNGSPGSGSPSSSGHPSSGSGNSGSGNSGSGNSGSGNSGSGNTGSGSGGSGSATRILQTTSTQLVVTVDLAPTVQSEAVLGEHVTVEMPNGDVVNGKITAVSPVAQNSSNGNNGSGNGNNGNGNGGNNGNGNNGSGSSSTIPVTITLSGHDTGAGLDQSAVSVNFVQQKATNVLSVPVTALLATGGGNYAVQEASVPHTLIPVTTGLFAAGYVEISGSGIYPGLAVTDSQG